MKQTLLDKLMSKVEFKEYYPSKHAKKVKAKLSYLHVSTKVVTYKDAVGVVKEAIVGITYVKAKD
jgi:hypothetical protein